jgi:hypothetical protein
MLELSEASVQHTFPNAALPFVVPDVAKRSRRLTARPVDLHLLFFVSQM